MSLLNNLLGGLLGGGGGSKVAGNIFTKFLTIADLWDTTLETASGKIAVKSGSWYRIGQYQIPAQQVYHYGFGRADLPFNQGYIYLSTKDDTGTPVYINGKVRLVQQNAQGTVKLVVWEGRTEQLYASASDKQQMIAMPEQIQFPYVGEDSYLALEIWADSGTAVNITKANCDWRIPATVVQ